MSATWKIMLFVTLAQSSLSSSICVGDEASCVNAQDETSLMQMQKNVNFGSKRSVQSPMEEQEESSETTVTMEDPPLPPTPPTDQEQEESSESMEDPPLPPTPPKDQEQEESSETMEDPPLPPTPPKDQGDQADEDRLVKEAATTAADQQAEGDQAKMEAEHEEGRAAAVVLHRTIQAEEDRIAHASEMSGESRQAAKDQAQIQAAEDHGAEMRANEEASAADHERATLDREQHEEQVAQQQAAEDRAEAEAAQQRQEQAEEQEAAEEQQAAEEQEQEQEQEEVQAARDEAEATEEAHEEDVHDHPEKYAAHNAYKTASASIHDAADEKRDFVEEVSKERHEAVVTAAEKLAAQRQRYAADVKEDQNEVLDDAAERDAAIQEQYDSVQNAKHQWEHSVVKKKKTEVAAIVGRAQGINHAVAEEHHEDVEAEEAAVEHHHAINVDRAQMHHEHMKQLGKDMVNHHTQKLEEAEEGAVARAAQAVDQAVEHAGNVAAAWDNHFDRQQEYAGHKAEQAVHKYSHGIRHNQEDTDEAVAVR